nr:YfiR family protein [Fulvivirga sedimenti]
MQGNAQNYQLHAVYIYSFTRYIQWPENDNSEFIIGVLGKDSEVIPHLEKMAEVKKVNNKQIQIEVFDSPSMISKCDMLFLDKEWSTDNEFVDEWVEKARSNHFLLLTNEQPLTGLSHINFTEDNNKLIFELNRKRIESSGLRVSTELLALAKIVDYQE